MRVLSAGYGTTVQDCGRFGFRRFGVPIAGALDASALRILNLLVGNEECAAGLELSSGRVRVEFEDDRLIGWSGGDFEMRIGTVTVPQVRCARVNAGTGCEIAAKRGRAWLAVSGGIDVPVVLGSRSTDLRAGFGGLDGRALRDGDELPLAKPSEFTQNIARQMSGRVSNWSAPEQVPASPGTLRIVPGKDWTEDTGAKLLNGTFRVALNSDRMGLRLEGTNLRTAHPELVSEAVTPGTIQLPPAGAPIVLLADCQTIGGYPKLGHVITVDLSRAAQLQPQDRVRFELTTVEKARASLRQREHDIAVFRAGLSARFG